MAEFDPAFERTVDIEGGYSHDPADRGGETLCGISRVHHPDWCGWPLVDAHLFGMGDSALLVEMPVLKKMIFDFYLDTFWLRMRLDRITAQAIAAEVFDSAVNCGVTTAVTWLQHACNLIGRSNALLVEDGRVGPKTIVVVNQVVSEFGVEPLLKALNGLQFGYYHTIVLRDPKQLRFLRGWLRRIWEHS